MFSMSELESVVPSASQAPVVVDTPGNNIVWLHQVIRFAVPQT